MLVVIKSGHRSNELENRGAYRGIFQKAQTARDSHAGVSNSGLCPHRRTPGCAGE